jgi:hypothetical protein
MMLDRLTGVPNARVAFVCLEFTCQNRKLDEVKAAVDFTVEEATETDIKNLGERLQGTGYPKGLELAVKYGSTVYLAKAADILGFSLINRKVASIADGVALRRLTPGEAYSHYSYIFPEYRGKKVFQKLKRDIYAREFGMGAEKIISIVDETNTPSIKAQEHLNAQARRFAWIVDDRQLRQLNQAGEESTEIRGKIVYEGEPRYRLYHAIGVLDELYHKLRKTLKEKISPRTNNPCASPGTPKPP